MLTRALLILLLLFLLARAIWRLLGGIVAGASSSPGRASMPRTGSHMVRDPVCGTFVVQSRALSARGADGAVHYFCSDRCRDQYDGRRAARDQSRGRAG